MGPLPPTVYIFRKSSVWACMGFLEVEAYMTRELECSSMSLEC